MWSIFSLLVLSAHVAMGWVSGGDKSDPAYLDTNRLTVSRESDPKPLRIMFDLDLGAATGSNLVSMADYPDIGLMTKSVQTFFANSLCVNRVQGEYEIVEKTCIGNGVAVNPRVYSGGDVFIILRATSSPSTTTGFSQVAFLDNGPKNQPLVGVITINKELFDSEPDYMQKWTFLAHLTIHVLGFSQALYPYWVDASNPLFPKIGTSNIVQTFTFRGVEKKAIVTPKALAEARLAFNYPGMVGVELEEDLALGYRSEHWDARLLFNDVSCVRSYREMIISSVTLALLEDSGWYKICGCKGTTPIFGKDFGCSFVEQPCINAGKASNHGNLWCSSTKTGTCDAFNLNKASCSILKPVIHPFQMIPLKAEEYFGDQTTGGRDRFTDFCPYPIPETNGNCRTPKGTPGAGETYGPNSRCFEHTLELGVTGKYPSSVASCFDVKCLVDGTSEVTIGGTKIVCPAAGGIVTVPVSLSPSGWIRCPPSSSLCGSVPCINACNGQGCCNNGVCSCFNGWSGSECNVPCPDRCLVCSLGPCTQCEPGYYVDPATGLCEKCSFCCLTCDSATSCLTSKPGCNGIDPICSDNCQSCNVPYSCVTPNPGYCFSNITGELKTCCNGCKTCSEKDCCNCLECLPGYMKTAINTCTSSCVANCLTCKSTTECLDCKVGFNLTPDGRCLRCPDGCVDCLNKCSSDQCGVVTGCLVQSTCDDYCFDCAQVECIGCKAGYRPTANKLCERICPLNCAYCSTKTTPPVCTLCNSGFFLNTLNTPPTCDPCETACLKCEYVSPTTTNCKSCRSGFFLRLQTKNGVSENDCVDCETGCYSCIDELSCSGCVARFYLKNLHCYRCEYGCKTCTDEFKCTSADPGFFIKDDGHVARCHKSCATCDADLICNTCMAGFFFFECSSENCLCRDCGDFCAQCSSPVECIICRSGYFLDANHRCTVCDYLCSSCEMAGKCLSCRWGYYLKADKTCGKCDVGCQNCVDFEHCKLCLGGFYPDEYFCNPCPDKCAFCWSPSQCYSCLTGWWLDKVNYFVPTCVACPTTCIRCNSLNDCVLCKRTYFVKAGICTKCGPNCAFCTSETVCTICEMGFFLDSDSTCKPCQGGCFDCCDAHTCMKAKNGWWLQYFPTLYYDLNREAAVGAGLSPDKLGGYVASPCVDKCISCFSLKDCGACTRGAYLLDDKECKTCEFPCSQCRTKTECILCAPKYYLKGTTCLPCAENCNACTETECTAPKVGYYPNPTYKFNVTLCVGFCNACVGSGPNDCINCKSGYGIVVDSQVRFSAVVYTYVCSLCDTGCRTCNPRDSCTAPLAGYYLLPKVLAPSVSGPPSGPIPVTNGVGKCPTTCTSCILKDNVVTCQACISKYGLEDPDCVPCSDLNCLKCSPRNVCQVCASKYYVNDDGGCSPCVSPCSLCKSAELCQSCVSKFYLPDPKVPSKCSNCILNCLRCTTGENCSQCAAKMYFNSALKSCELCPANCTACIEVDSTDNDGNPIKVVQCTACAGRCAVDGLLCKPCVSPFCTTCRPIGVCSACQGGYYLDDVTKDCIKCDLPCNTCKSKSYCLTCSGATYLDVNEPGSCKTCLTNCNKCTSAVDCSSVRGGYYLSAGGTPQAIVNICPPACTACREIIIDNQVYVNCTTCRSNYILTLSAVPQIFKCCINGCSSCDNLLTCGSCITGWSLTSSKLCFKCSNFCDSCTSATKCSKCSPNYFLYQSSICCPANCLNCNSAQYCWNCIKGKFWKDGNCIDCLEGCNSCDKDVCVDCLDGFYMGGKQCWKCPDKCTKCDSETYCSNCIDGYLPNTATGACEINVPSSSPSGCNEGLYLDGTDCKPCPTGCAQCSSFWSCSKALPGYWIYADATACPDQCSECNPSTTTPHNLCYRCFKTYYLQNYACINCPSECEECDGSVCTKCKQGYDFFGTTCLLKSQIPSSVTCSSGFYPDGTVCKSCPTGCAECSGTWSCSKALSGYWLYTNSIACPAKCSECNPSSTVPHNLCYQCFTTYYRQGNDCINCPSECETCDNSVCSKCKDGYEPNGSTGCVLSKAPV